MYSLRKHDEYAENYKILAPITGSKNAQRLMTTFRTFNRIAKASNAELSEAVPSLKDTQISRLRASFRLGSALVHEEFPQPYTLWTSFDRANFMREYFRYAKYEELYGLYMNSSCQVVGVRKIAEGSISKVSASTPDFYKPAIQMDATDVVMFHNHPRIDSTPSDDDIRVSKRFADAGRALSIRLLDHIVIGEKSYSDPEGYTSIGDEGLLSFNLYYE